MAASAVDSAHRHHAVTRVGGAAGAGATVCVTRAWAIAQEVDHARAVARRLREQARDGGPIWHEFNAVAFRLNVGANFAARLAEDAERYEDPERAERELWRR